MFGRFDKMYWKYFVVFEHIAKVIFDLFLYLLYIDVIRISRKSDLESDKPIFFKSQHTLTF